MQVDPELRSTTVRHGGKPDDGKDGRLYWLCYLWGQYTLGVAGPRDDVFLEGFEHTWKTRLASTTTPWGSIVTKDSKTPNSLLWAIK